MSSYGEKFDAYYKAVEEALPTFLPQGDTPVSYTHLDVYKRQEEYNDQISGTASDFLLRDAGRMGEGSWDEPSGWRIGAMV